MAAAKKKTAKAVKKGPAAGGAPLRLEVGKRYRNRGDYMTVEITGNRKDKYPMVGIAKYDNGAGGQYSWMRDGTFMYKGVPDLADLVREVPRPKGAA